MFNVIKIEETTSTMDYIKNCDINTVVVANKQTSGRGKGDRLWISQKSNNLYMSIKMDSSNKSINYSNYCFLSAVAMVESIKELVDKNNNKKDTDVNIKIKWPNDILLNDKKICGILLENDIQTQMLIIGIGLNIDYSPNIDDKNMIFRPTDLKKEGIVVNKDELIDVFLKYFDIYSNDIQIYGFKNVRQILLKYAYNLHKKITVKNNNVEFSGIFHDIDENGTLILHDEGRIIKISSGDVF